MGITAGWIIRFGPQSFTFIYEKWVGLLTASLVMSVFQATYVYAMSYYGEKILALGGNSGNPIYDVRAILLCPESLTDEPHYASSSSVAS